MMGAQFTPGPWELCRHLESIEADAACSCGYRGVVYGPEHDVAMAICQPGHQPAPEGQEGSEPCRYPRDVEIANAHLIAAAPDLYGALVAVRARFQHYRHGPDEQMVMDRVNAALAKARGEQP